MQSYLNHDAEKEAQAAVTINASKAEAQKLAQHTKIVPSSTNKPNNIEIISRYIEAKLKEIKTYEGTSLARDAKEELRSYLQTFQKDKRMLQDFRNHSPELVKDIQQLYQKQQRIQEHIRQKDYGMDM